LPKKADKGALRGSFASQGRALATIAICAQKLQVPLSGRAAYRKRYDVVEFQVVVRAAAYALAMISLPDPELYFSWNRLALTSIIELIRHGLKSMGFLQAEPLSVPAFVYER
jgi:hypothetical protein